MGCSWYPAFQYVVKRRRTDDRRAAGVECRRAEDEGTRLRAAESTMRADQLLERRHLAAPQSPMRAGQLLERRDLVGLIPIGTIDQDVGSVGEPVVTAKVRRRVP